MSSKTNPKMCLIISLAFLTITGSNAKADFTFGQPTNLGPNVNSSAMEEGPSISADGLTLYFNSNRSGGSGNFDLWMTTRDTKDGPWGEPENLGPKVNSSSNEAAPSISADGRTLVFNRGYSSIYATIRETKDAPWGTPVSLSLSLGAGYGPNISADGLSLYFGSNRSGGFGSDDIWVSTRATTDDPWQEPVNLGPIVNSSAHEARPSISSDGRVLFFSGYAMGPYRDGGYGIADIWMTTRATASDPWGTPVNLGPTVNTSYHDFFPSISADGSTLYFMCSPNLGGEGGWDLWQVSIEPVVDLNGDGIVDAADMCIVVDYWGTEEQLCDIGPMPWGDGVVDVQDLIVLAEHLFEEIPPVK